jgi:transcriptional regulator with XRE-family HTH domain
MKEKGITRQALCKELDIKYTTLCDWVNGRSVPRTGQLDALSKYFDIETGEFFIETRRSDNAQAISRLRRYSSESRRLDMNALNNMSDSQVKELIKAGFTFSHKTLEEYVNETGGTLIASDEIDWGDPVGSEVW